MNMLLNLKFKIYIYIKSFYYAYIIRDLKILFIFLKKYKLNFLKKKIIFLPLNIKKFSVIRSPFVSKLSKEHFEIKIYKALIILSFKNKLFMEFFRKKKLIKFDFNYIYYKVIYLYSIL